MFDRLKRLFARKSPPAALTGGQWSGGSFVDRYKREREPGANELLQELKQTAWSCASINAAVCASHQPRLYVATGDSQPEARALKKAVTPAEEKRLRRLPGLPPRITKAARLEEILDHPLLTLLSQVNPVHNAFDLFELTTLYQEVHGSAYWLLNFGPLGIPDQIWILPSQNVAPKRDPSSPALVDYYEYRSGSRLQKFPADQVIHFRYPDPRNPYTSGLSPLRACFEQVALTSDYAAFKQAKFENRALPDAVVSPDEVMGEEERERFETEWNMKLRRGGAGKVIVSESALRVQLLNQSLGDIALLADVKAAKEDVANAFHVPISFLTSQTNLANLLAAQTQHMQQAITPGFSAGTKRSTSSSSRSMTRAAGFSWPARIQSPSIRA